MPAHLLFVSGTALSANNGSSRVERTLATLGAERFAITLLTRDETALGPGPFEHRLYRRPSSKSWWQWLRAGRVAETIAAIHREQPIHLVHGFGFFPVALYVARFARRSGVPYVLTHHDMRLLPGAPGLRGATLAALRCAQMVTCLNEAQRVALLRAGILEDRLTVIPNGAGAAREEAAPIDPPPGFVAPIDPPPGFVLFAGRFEREKGVHLLLDALAMVPKERRPALVLAGAGRDEAWVQARAADLGATTLPWLPHGALTGLIKRARAVVLPSFSEGSPLLLLEAYAREVEVIAHDLPELEEALRDADGTPLGRLIPVGDRAAWAEALEQTRGQVDRAQIARAKARAEERSWAKIAAQYHAIYQRILQGSAVARLATAGPGRRK
ncbi:MAG: glycosyltransferase family 4 protein [Deltaproteobacteria bacterium]|nr:glycosyltransferase family 4 protein [Deltaproteobacteria bacterium]